jgi:mono/diheme cytochrome c family protein
MNRLRLTFIAYFLVSAFASSGAQNSGSAETLAENPVFQKDCAKCHGKTAEGRHFAGPSLVSEQTTSTSADDLNNIITNGKHHMPKFAGKLTADEINTLVHQIKASKKN